MENPKTLEELCDYIFEYKDVIFIREQIDGKWGSYSLLELPTELALKFGRSYIQDMEWFIQEDE